MTAGPLSGVRVLELAGLGPAPFCGMLLADLGAEVVVVHRPSHNALFGDSRADLLNRGKRSVAVNLKHEQGAEVVLRLAEKADILLEGFRPGVAERLGVGPEQCWERNPKLVYGRMTGWGQDGPLSQTAGHDNGYIALSGVLHAIGRAGGPPQLPINLLGDFGGGAMYLAVGVLAALLRARLDGTGQVVDAAIVDGTAHLATMVFGLLGIGAWQDQRGVNILDTGAPWYDVYETSDGRHMAVGSIEPQFFAELVDRLGIAETAPPQHDQSRWPELRATLTEIFRSRTMREWEEVFAGSDACVAPVLTLTEAPEHPQLAARGTYVEHNGIRQPAPAPKFSATPAALDRTPPRPGEHSKEVLSEWGFTDFDDLASAGAVATL